MLGGQMAAQHLLLYQKNHRLCRWFLKAFAIPSFAAAISLPLMREVDFAKQKTEGEKSLPQSRLAPCQPPRQRGPLVHTTGTADGYNFSRFSKVAELREVRCTLWKPYSAVTT